MMKRMIGFLLAAAVLLALAPSAAFASSEEPVQDRSGSLAAALTNPTERSKTTVEGTADGTSVAIVNCKLAVNVRKGPGSNTAKIGTAKKGRIFKLLGVEADGKWYRIQYTASTVGYVFHTYVKVGNATPDPFDTAKTGTIVNCKTQVNVREKASSKSKLLGVAKKGETFDVLGRTGNWVKIDYHGKSAYVFHTYIRVDDETTATGTIVNCKTQVNVREKASSKSKLLGVAKKGETFDVLGKSGNWVKIDYHGTAAYVFHTYIKVK